VTADRARAIADRIMSEWQRGMTADRWRGLARGRILTEDLAVRMDVPGPMQALLVVTIDDTEHTFDFPEDWDAWLLDAQTLGRTDLLEVAQEIALVPEYEWWT
jgi:hypothetical protein